MSTRLLILAVFFASLGATTEVSAQVPIPEVPEHHPRLYIQADELADLRSRIERSPYREVWDEIRSSDDYLLRALVYLIEGDEQEGREAIEEALVDLHAEDAFSRSRGFSSPFHKSACVYDWAYPLLSEEQKQRFIERFIELARTPNSRGTIYIGYPARMNVNPSTGHQNEGYLMTAQLPAGIAIYDENQTMYDAAARLFIERFAPVRSFFYPGHYHHQGTFYGVGRFHYDVNTSWLFRAMGAGDVLHRDQQFVPYYFMYMRRGDGVAFPVGDAIAGSDWDRLTPKVGSYYNDPYLLGAAPKRTPGDEFGLLFDLLFRDYETEPKPTEDLPLTRYFPSPQGAMVARTGWDIGPHSRDAAAYMHIGEAWLGNHEHYDYGTFQIAYRGPLAIASGYYDSYGSEHMRNYYNPLISTNGLLIFDPDDTILFHQNEVANDGGQTPQPENAHESLPVHRMGKVTAHAFGPDEIEPDYSYISGDITDAYNSQKTELVTRSMVTFNFKEDRYPLAMVVFDRVHSTDPAFKKTWLLHSMQEPEIDGRTIDIVRTGQNRGTRLIEMPADAEFGGRLIVESLLPRDAVIEKVGGENAFWVESAARTFPPEMKPRKGRAFHPGGWRVEVSPPTDDNDHRFLHVLTAMDVETEEGPVVETIDSEGTIGARVHNRIVLFGMDSEPRTEAKFVLPSGEGFGVLVCDLAPGRYEMLDDSGGVLRSDLAVSEEGGSLYFEAEGGTYSLRRTSGEAPAGEPDFWDRLRREVSR